MIERSTSEGKRVGELRRALARRLKAGLPAGQREAAELDARLIAAAALDIEPAALLRHDGLPVSLELEAAVEAMTARRLAGEPVARILGRKEFWSLSFGLSPETLVPRPDTETLVAAALQWAEGRESGSLRIVDLGTGSGAILLAVLWQLPNTVGIGTDLSAGALRTAERNAESLGLLDRSLFVRADWSAALKGPFNLVLANPPYVESGAIGGLDKEVSRFDPLLALDGGPDGLAAYRVIIGDLARLLATDGAAFVEVGAGEAQIVAEFGRKQRLVPFFHCDLAGHERVVELRPEPAEGA